MSRWAPPPKLTVSEWADQNRRLSPESSAEIGQWETDRAEYQRGIMDAFSDPEVETVVVMSSAQIGKTELISNVIAYFIDQDPSPILLVYPTLDVAMSYSKDRLAPMIRDNPCLQGKVKDVRSRDSGNTLLHKTFPGGHITIAGANSPASLSSRPIRIVLCDEVDRYPESAGTEGDPVKLAQKRSNNFWNRKHMLMSTPTLKDASRIDLAYRQSDMRKYWVPCPHCHGSQTLKWSQVRWPSPKGEGKWKAPQHEPQKAIYLCEHCQAELTHADKLRMVQRGDWRAEAPCTGMAGFWINELYSPWVTFAKMAADFLEAKRSGPKQMQVFINTSLAELWEMQGGEQLDQNLFYNRRETYGPEVPAGAALLTASADIQHDRIEVEVKAWGKGEECWGLEHKIFYGSTLDATGGAWHDLDEYLKTTFTHTSRIPLRIACATIDTGDGQRTKEAYAFVKPRQFRRIFAVKGSKDRGRPMVSRPVKSSVLQVKLFMVGTDTAKSTIYGRLKGLQEPGPGYMHFPMAYDLEYFEQLTAEKQVTQYKKGFREITWEKTRPRNEALDLTVYNLAALAILNANLDRLVDDLNKRAGTLAPPKAGPEEQPPPEKPEPLPPKPTFVNRGAPRRRGGFVKRWKG